VIVLNSVLKLIQRIQPATANVVKISLGSLGCLGGGGGNLRNVSLHDSTCQCEGCVEKRLADQEFSLTTENFNGERDYGFNVGDEGGPDAPGEIIVLTDDDDDDENSSDNESDSSSSSSDKSYIFDAYHDKPSDDDTGYGDDGQDSEDAYSVFSPKPYHHSSSEETESDDDITDDEDTPLETAVQHSAIEAARRDGESINTCVAELEKMEHPTIRQKTLQSFINNHQNSNNHTLQLYETKILSMFKQLTRYAEVIQAAKRRMDHDAAEISRLRDLCMEKTEQVNKKDEELYTMAEDMGRMALRHNRLHDRQSESLRTLRQRLQDEQTKNQTIEEELRFTRKRLLTHTRRSVPRTCKRVRRCIDFDNTSENEEQTHIALTAAMTNLNTTV